MNKNTWFDTWSVVQHCGARKAGDWFRLHQRKDHLLMFSFNFRMSHNICQWLRVPLFWWTVLVIDGDGAIEIIDFEFFQTTFFSFCKQQATKHRNQKPNTFYALKTIFLARQISTVFFSVSACPSLNPNLFVHLEKKKN